MRKPEQFTENLSDKNRSSWHPQRHEKESCRLQVSK